MRKIYVAHPLRGGELDLAKIERNVARVTEIMRELAADEPDLLLFSPIHAFGYLSPTCDDKWVMSQCLEMVKTCDEVWVYGEWRKSKGCIREVNRARALGRPVIFKESYEWCV